MSSMTPFAKRALANLRALKGNPYPGRIVIVALSKCGQYFIQVAAILGRSAGSCNREYQPVEGREFQSVTTSFIDPNGPGTENPENIIYITMDEGLHCPPTGPHVLHCVVSNGHQTTTVLKDVKEGGFSFENSLHNGPYSENEGDGINLTSRITAYLRLQSDGKCVKYVVKFGIARKKNATSPCKRHFFETSEVIPGFGYCLHTYAGDATNGFRLPPYRGNKPLIVSLEGDTPEAVAEEVWRLLPADKRLSVVVKFIPLDISAHALIAIKNGENPPKS